MNQLPISSDVNFLTGQLLNIFNKNKYFLTKKVSCSELNTASYAICFIESHIEQVQKLTLVVSLVVAMMFIPW